MLEEAARPPSNGIELITVNGDESPADAFRQGDARIAAGAFEYQLKQQGKNWYLTSYQSVNEEDNSSEGNSESTETPTPFCAPKLEVTSPTWQPLTLFLLCV